MTNLPDYDDLPEAGWGGRSAWGLFGDDDVVGLMNLMTPERVRSAIGLVESGRVFPLDAPLDFFDPPLFQRARYAIDVRIGIEGRSIDEVYQHFNPQAFSQWDSLAHVPYRSDMFYNGATLQEVLEGRNSVGHWAKRGIVARGLLLDLQRSAERNGRPYVPGSEHAFTVEDLERARVEAGVEFTDGAVIVLRTGFMDWYSGLSPEQRVQASTAENLKACGIERTEEMARYLWNSHASAVVADNPSVEVFPVDFSADAAPWGFLHKILIGQLGLGLGELWWLEDLARDCAEDGRNEFLLTSAPFNSPTGVGSTANALAIK